MPATGSFKWIWLADMLPASWPSCWAVVQVLLSQTKISEGIDFAVYVRKSLRVFMKMIDF